LFDFEELENKTESEIPGNIKQLADDRINAKKNKDYKLADDIRDQIKNL
jgi:cysteinyl-tRNA synthetase